jgi:two-component system, LuxR family, response regulator FixJ
MPTSLVHVVDDDPAMRESVAFLLDTAGFTVALYEDGVSFLRQLTADADGTVLTDIRMPGLDGLELLRRLRVDGYTVPVVMMTGHSDISLAVEAMKLGACDFIEKPFEDEALLRAIRAAPQHTRGPKTTDPRLQDFAQRVATLSERERQVLDHLVAGGTSKEIGRALDISPRTVEIYRAKLMAKTQAISLSELVRWTVLIGLNKA